MKKVYDDDEFVVEHFTDEDDCVIENLTEEENEETDGGAAQYTAYSAGRKGKYYGRINCSTNGQTCYVPSVLKRLGSVSKVEWISNSIGATADWTPNIFVVSKKKLRGSALLKVYAKNGDYVQVLAKFT